MGADHFREATKKLYDVELLRAVAAAVVVTAVASCVLVRGRNAECRNRARVVICQLPAHIVTQIERLSVLACRKLRNKELLVLLGDLRVLRRKLLRRQTLVDAAEAAVHRVDDVARGVLHGVAGVACLRRHVVAHLGD